MSCFLYNVYFWDFESRETRKFQCHARSEESAKRMCENHMALWNIEGKILSAEVCEDE